MVFDFCRSSNDSIGFREPIAWVVWFFLSIGLFVLVLGCACEVFLGVLLPVSFVVLGSVCRRLLCLSIHV